MQPSLLDRIINTALFYLGWILSLKEAADGHPFYGLMVVMFIIAYQLYRSPQRQADGLLLLLVICIGPLSDVLYAQIGLLQYHTLSHTIPGMPPLWLFFLWGLFAVNIPLFSWLKKHWLLAILFGGFGAPLSYLSAIRLGGADLLLPTPWVFLVVGGTWAVLLPAVIWLSDTLKTRLAQKE